MTSFWQDTGLYFSLGLVLLAVLISWREGLQLEKDLIWASLRGFFQLTLVGYILLWIFSQEGMAIVYITLALMTVMAAWIVHSRAEGIPRTFPTAIFCLALSLSLTLGLLVLGGSIDAKPRLLIPLGGMILGNSMNGASLTLNRLKSEVELRKNEILLYLSLGASSRQSMQKILQTVLKTSLIPAIDTLKTLGLIFMPGMMAGLIIAGESPLVAVRYQIVVMFMLLASATLTNLLIALIAYRRFFTPAHQLRDLAEMA
jgi:putative ABC transport system permease protein